MVFIIPIVTIILIVMTKIAWFYLITKLHRSKNKRIRAEDIINKPLDSSIPKIQKPIRRDEQIENKYEEVKSIFSYKMKTKQMNRDEILALRNYLTLYLHGYENKKFKNDCHAIYCMLKAKDLTLCQLNEIELFLNSIN